MSAPVGGRAVKANGGRREDLGIYVRSGWEANVARYLNFLKAQKNIIAWEYEPTVFDFPIKRGTMFYLPDFKVHLSPGKYQWWEVKGWMDAASATKIKRFRKYYPEEFDRFILIGPSEYRAIEKYKALVKGWE